MNKKPGHEPQIRKKFFIKNWRFLLIWAIIISAIFIGKHFNLDKKIMAFGIIVYGIISGAFLWLLGIVGVVPVIGPIIVKIFTLPAIWIVNGFAYIVTILALKKGAKLDILKSRVLVISFIIGVVIGFILGKLL